jgi:hypothetical protein
MLVAIQLALRLDDGLHVEYQHRGKTVLGSAYRETSAPIVVSDILSNQ